MTWKSNPYWPGPCSTKKTLHISFFFFNSKHRKNFARIFPERRVKSAESQKKSSWNFFLPVVFSHFLSSYRQIAFPILLFFHPRVPTCLPTHNLYLNLSRYLLLKLCFFYVSSNLSQLPFHFRTKINCFHYFSPKTERTKYSLSAESLPQQR